MTYSDAEKIYLSLKDTSLLKLKTDLILSSIRYSRLRVDWRFADFEEKKILDQERTVAHNSFIDCCNILSRNMTKANEDTKWRDYLGNDRKTIGDFACYLNCIWGIEAR